MKGGWVGHVLEVTTKQQLAKQYRGNWLHEQLRLQSIGMHITCCVMSPIMHCQVHCIPECHMLCLPVFSCLSLRHVCLLTFMYQRAFTKPALWTGLDWTLD